MTLLAAIDLMRLIGGFGLFLMGVLVGAVLTAFAYEW